LIDHRIDLGAYEYRPLEINSIRIHDHHSLVSFPTVLGNAYDLEGTHGFADNPWMPVITNRSGVDGSVEVMDPAEADDSRRFYRVRALF
jgi:hypothetical protein